jgi:abhydrolase domain-containing protein 6
VNRPWNDRVFQEMGKKPFPLESHLGAIRARTLVLWGAEDKVLHKSGGPVFVGGIKDAQLVIMEGTGHTPMIERPADTAAVVADFVGIGG